MIGRCRRRVDQCSQWTCGPGGLFRFNYLVERLRLSIDTTAGRVRGLTDVGNLALPPPPSWLHSSHLETERSWCWLTVVVAGVPVCHPASPLLSSPPVSSHPPAWTHPPPLSSPLPISSNLLESLIQIPHSNWAIYKVSAKIVISISANRNVTSAHL